MIVRVQEALREWGIDTSVIVPNGTEASPLILKCAENSARLMADAQRRRMMQ